MNREDINTDAYLQDLEKEILCLLEDYFEGLNSLYTKDIDTISDIIYSLMTDKKIEFKEKKTADPIVRKQQDVCDMLLLLKKENREQILLALSQKLKYDIERGAVEVHDSVESIFSEGQVKKLTELLIEVFQVHMESKGLQCIASPPDAMTDREKEFLCLQTICKTNGRFAKEKVAIEKGCLELKDEENVVVIIDSHQNKHQNPQLGQLLTYTGKKGTCFAEGTTLDWHRNNTCEVVFYIVKYAVKKGWVTKEKEYTLPKTSLDRIFDLRDVFLLEEDALFTCRYLVYEVIYDLHICYDPETGKYVGKYHCNPRQEL